MLTYLLMDNEYLLIRKCSLWSDLSEEEYKELEVQDNFKKFKKGEYIYIEAFSLNKIYFIKEGYVLLGKIHNSGQVITKEIIEPGDFFGQYILEKNSLDGEFAQAIKSNVSLCSFKLERFTQLLEKNPALSIKYSKLIGLRLKKFENRFLNIIHKDIETRILLFLRGMLNEQQWKKALENNEIEIPNYLTHEEIAQLVGSSRQTVTSKINELETKGALQYSRKLIKLLNIRSTFISEFYH